MFCELWFYNDSFFFQKNYISDNWNKIDFVIVVGSIIDVVLDLLKVFHFSCFHCYLLFAAASALSIDQGIYYQCFEWLQQQKEIFSFLYVFHSFIFFHLHCYLLPDVSALLIDVLDSGHQLSSVPGGSSSKNLKEVHVLKVSVVELLSINEGTFTAY